MLDRLLLKSLESNRLPQGRNLDLSLVLSWVLLPSIGSLGEGGLEVTASVTRNHGICSSLYITFLNLWDKSREEKVALQRFFRVMPHSMLYGGDTETTEGSQRAK